jgi:hypothetical protein
MSNIIPYICRYKNFTYSKSSVISTKNTSYLLKKHQKHFITYAFYQAKFHFAIYLSIGTTY